MDVLVAEDDRISRHRLQVTLQRWGLSVTAVSDGAEALRELRRPDPPGLAVLDWMMPNIDGLDVCRAIRQASDGPYIYLILLSSQDGDGDVVAGFDAGADDYITKPFNIQELEARIRAGTRIVRLQRQLAAAALHDPLTGLLNRRAFFDLTEKEVARARREHVPLGLVMLDLDHFKDVNDQHGHLAGDAVLRETANRLRAAVRVTDSVGRYGGEEFVVALPRSGLKDAVAVAERVRASIANEPFEIPSGLLSMTTSVGVAVTWNMNEAAHLLNTADAALYRAKAGGRNRVEADFHAAA